MEMISQVKAAVADKESTDYADVDDADKASSKIKAKAKPQKVGCLCF